jgi:hypothetical protein
VGFGVAVGSGFGGAAAGVSVRSAELSIAAGDCAPPAAEGGAWTTAGVAGEQALRQNTVTRITTKILYRFIFSSINLFWHFMNRTNSGSAFCIQLYKAVKTGNI